MSKWDQLIDASESLAQSCIDIVVQQNADSYKVAPIPKLEVLNFNPKTFSPYEAHLVKFYQKCMSIVKFSHNLKYTLRSMVYPHSEVTIHIDRSPAFILKLERKLAERTNQLNEYLSQLNQNIQHIKDNFCDQLNEIVVDTKYLELIYHCMHYDFKFIPLGVSILNRLFANELISELYQNDLRRLSSEIKLKYLDESADKSKLDQSIDCMLQTFNLFPTLYNLTLPEIFTKVFGLNIQSVTIDNLERVLKSNSNSLPKPISFIVIAKHNNDFYYDLTNLFDQNKLSKISSKAGISAEYIDVYQTLRSIIVKKKSSNEVTTYNQQNDSDTYLLWTNDYIQFKVCEHPIPAIIVNKILANESSNIIDKYNNQFEQKMLDVIKNDSLVSYKQVKYLSFETDTEEVTFINQICNKLIKRIKSIKNIATADDLSDQFIKIFQSEFDGFKPFHKNGSIPIHALLVYSNMAVRLSNRLEKELIVWAFSGQSIDEIESIIRTIIASNDNIYSKFIASYYLSISGVNT